MQPQERSEMLAYIGQITKYRKSDDRIEVVTIGTYSDYLILLQSSVTGPWDYGWRLTGTQLLDNPETIA
jgi:hypothetical protein